MKVLRQRIEYKTHIFELPEGVNPDSEEAQEIYDDYDWGNSSIEHAEEENLQVMESEVSSQCNPKCNHDEFRQESCWFYFWEWLAR